jgi:hypothetical protein
MNTLQYPGRPVTFGLSSKETMAALAAHHERVEVYLSQTDRRCMICGGRLVERRIAHLACEYDPRDCED